MKRSWFTSCVSVGSGILLLSAFAYFQDAGKSVAQLKSENNRLTAIANDRGVSADIRELNKELLNKNRGKLRDALIKSIGDLEAYARQNADMLDGDDLKNIRDRIEANRYDLAQLEPGIPPANRAIAATGDESSRGTLKPTVFVDNSVVAPVKQLFTGPASPFVPAAAIPGQASPALAGANRSGAPAPMLKYTLTVDTKGTNGGKGTVISSGAGEINCGKACTADYADHAHVFLFYVAEKGSKLASWSDPNCGANASCEVVFNGADIALTATFDGPPPAPAAVAAAATPEPTPVPDYDWGRVRAYFTSGILLSKDRDVTSTERNNFSKPDLYLDFTLDSAYFMNGKDRNKRDFGPFNHINTFFSARMTSIPVSNSAKAAASGTPSPSPSPGSTPCNSADCSVFITSEKGAKLEAGIYAPIYLGGRWHFEANDHTLFFAPIVKGGIQTITGDRTSSTAEARRFGGDDIYNSYSFGGMLGHYKLPNDPDAAPELINFLSITHGRFENFEYLDPDGPKDASGNFLHRVRPWRWEAVGLLKVPRTPFVIGFNGNFGKGPDDLRFLFGMKFDIGNVIKKLDAKP